MDGGGPRPFGADESATAQEECATELGFKDRHQIINYEKGDSEIPKYVWLATVELDSLHKSATSGIQKILACDQQPVHTFGSNSEVSDDHVNVGSWGISGPQFRAAGLPGIATSGHTNLMRSVPFDCANRLGH